MKTTYTDRYRLKPGAKLRLLDVDPDLKNGSEDKASAQIEIAKDAEELARLQYLLYAENRRSLLICLQGLDAAGKDGTIKHVLGAMNPQGTRVHGFKVPSYEEAAHDFLWRAHKQAPGRGEIVIFNRSHYEDVLVVRVHQLVTKKVWSKRYDLINDFEKNLTENGTLILKFYLHIDEKEQLRRFEKRLEDPMRHWKISDADYAERAFWPEYIKAYEEALEKTSTDHAPWFVIPANHKWCRNLAVAKILVESLESLDMKLPAPTVDIEHIRKRYHAAREGQKELEEKLSEHT